MKILWNIVNSYCVLSLPWNSRSARYKKLYAGSTGNDCRIPSKLYGFQKGELLLKGIWQNSTRI